MEDQRHVKTRAVALVNWWELVQDLRRDEQLVASSWKEVNKCSQSLNGTCDNVFRSMWINQVLGSTLTQVLTHRLQPAEWVNAFDGSFAVSFVDGNQGLKSDRVSMYSRFLTSLHSNPAAVSEIILWAGYQGLSTSDLVSDMMAVLYGGCFFEEDHEKFLQLIIHLLTHHVNQCSTFKDLFVLEHEFSRAITEYCRYLPGLREFFVCSLQDSLIKIINYNERYLEYDVNKVGGRLQKGKFDVASYIDTSCTDLASMCMGVLKNLDIYKERLPASLRWIMSSMSQQIKSKWPNISSVEASRPVSDVFFRYILSAAFTTPGLVGILDPSITLNEMSSYNMSQVIGVLQGCAWIMNRSRHDSSDYPMKRVVKLMKMKRFVSLINWLEDMPTGSHPTVHPVLPGLRKSFFMASKEQLDDLVIISQEASTHFEDTSDANDAQQEVIKVASLGPNMLVESVTRNPYSFSIKLSHPTGSASPEHVDKGKKKKNSSSRSKSMWGVKSETMNSPSRKELAKSSNFGSTLPHSNSSSMTNLRLPMCPISEKFSMPREVYLMPFLLTDYKYQPTNSWDFQLLSEEEFLRPKNQHVLLSNVPNSTQPPPPSNSIENPPTSIGVSKAQRTVELENSHCSLQPNTCSTDRNEDYNNSVKSWSPETYNGSISGEEDGEAYSLAQKSLELDYELSLDQPLEESLYSSCPENHEVRKKSFKSWISHKIKKKQRTGMEYSESLPDRIDKSPDINQITAKYERISRENKLKEAKEAAKLKENQLPPPDSPLTLHIPSGVEEFESLPLYLQLKYKLSIVLSNIHIPEPLTSDLPTLTTRTTKKDIVAILEQSLFRNLWIADTSESGVILEVLSRVNELDEDCVRSLYFGIVQDQLNRQEYLRYLNNSRQKFTNIHLQLGSIQQLIDRSRQLEESAFLNFAIQLFLESNNDTLSKFEAELDQCKTSDEKYSSVQLYLEKFSRMLEFETMWNVWPEENLTRVNECLINHLFAHVYEQTFRPNGESDIQRDQVFSNLLKQLSLEVTPSHPLLKIQKVYLSTCPWPEVQKELLLMSSHKSPRGKLKCIIHACQLLIRSLQLSKCGEPPGADDTFPALVYILIKSNPSNLLSTEQYIKTFCDSLLMGEEAYWWTQFQSAIGFLRTPGFIQQ